MTRVCGAWSLKNNTWQPLVLIKPPQPSPEQKNPWPVTGKMWFGAARRNAARATQKRSAGLHIRLRDLPLAARIIWRRPAHSCYLSPRRVLHLTAWPTVEPPTRLSMSLPAGSRGGLVCLQCQKAVRKFPDPRYYWPFFSSEASTFSSVWQGKGGQGRSAHGGAGQDKHTWSVLNWVPPKLQRTLPQHFNASPPASKHARPLLQ